MTVPDDVRESLRRIVSERARSARWPGLTQSARTQLLDAWTADPIIGGSLESFMARSKVRSYIKDVLLRTGTRVSVRDGLETAMLRRASLSGHRVKRRLAKPGGVILENGKVITWGRAQDWKALILTAFERDEQGLGPCAAIVLTEAAGHMATPNIQKIVEDACRRLEVPAPIWLSGPA